MAAAVLKNRHWASNSSAIKLKNRHISTAVREISTKFGTMAQFDPLDSSDH